MKVYVVSSCVSKDCLDDGCVRCVFGSEKEAQKFVDEENKKGKHGFFYYEDFTVCRNKH